MEENLVKQALYRAMVDVPYAQNVFSELTFTEDTFGDYKDLAIEIRNHYHKYDTPLGKSALVNEMTARARRMRKLTEEKQSDIEDMVAEIAAVSKEDNYSNDPELKDQVDKWSRNIMAVAVITRGISNNKDLGSTENIDEILTGLNKAQMVGSTQGIFSKVSLFDKDNEDSVLSLLDDIKLDTVPVHWKALDDLLDGGLAKGEMGMVVAKSGSGKPLTWDTPVYTPKGIIKNGDLKVGDYVYNRLGKPVEIKGIYDKGELEEYKVTTDDGRVIRCNDGHLFSYWSISGQGKLGLVTKTLREMIDTGLAKTNGKGNIVHRYSIPTSSALEFPEQYLPVKPYTLGALLGDGSLTGKNLYMSASDDKLPILDRMVKENNWDGYHRNSKNWYTYVFYNGSHIDSPNRKIVHVSDLDLPSEALHYAKDKSIPEIYKIGSKEQRLALLQGLFDTDGSVHKRKASNTIRVTFSSTSAKLIEDVTYILRSLGYKASATVQQRNRRNKAGDLVTPEWNLGVGGTMPMLKALFSVPFKLKKFEGVKPKTSYHDRSRIISAEPTGRKVPMRCIYVDDPEHLYVAGDFIVTHNTTTLINMARQYAVTSKQDVLYIALEENISRMVFKLFRAITGQTTRDLYDDNENLYKEKVKNQLNALSLARDKGLIGDLMLYRSNPQTVTPKMVEQVLQEYLLSKGKYPDVVFIDYPDLMLNPNDRNVNEYRAMGMLYEDLRRIAGQCHLVLWVASQANRGASYEDTVDGSRTIEGSKQKLNTVEVSLSVNQTDAEFQKGFIRLHVDKVRNPKDNSFSKMLYFKVNKLSVNFEDETPQDNQVHLQVIAEANNDHFGQYKTPTNAQSTSSGKAKVAEANKKIVNSLYK